MSAVGLVCKLVYKLKCYWCSSYVHPIVISIHKTRTIGISVPLDFEITTTLNKRQNTTTVCKGFYIWEFHVISQSVSVPVKFKGQGHILNLNSRY